MPIRVETKANFLPFFRPALRGVLGRLLFGELCAGLELATASAARKSLGVFAPCFFMTPRASSDARGAFVSVRSGGSEEMHCWLRVEDAAFDLHTMQLQTSTLC